MVFFLHSFPILLSIIEKDLDSEGSMKLILLKIHPLGNKYHTTREEKLLIVNIYVKI